MHGWLSSGCGASACGPWLLHPRLRLHACPCDSLPPLRQSQALGDGAEAERLLRRARGVCGEVQHTYPELPGPASRKLQMLSALLQSGETAAAS